MLPSAKGGGRCSRISPGSAAEAALFCAGRTAGGAPLPVSTGEWSGGGASLWSEGAPLHDCPTWRRSDEARVKTRPHASHLNAFSDSEFLPPGLQGKVRLRWRFSSAGTRKVCLQVGHSLVSLAAMFSGMLRPQNRVLFFSACKMCTWGGKPRGICLFLAPKSRQ